MLETHIRGNKQNLLGNLRAFPPRGTVNEVWNHGIGKYVATYHAVPGKGERSVRLEVEVYGNSGSNLNNEDPKPRVNKYEYIIVYGLDGKVDVANPYTADWISVGGEAQYLPAEPPGSGLDPLGRPQPVHHRGQRPLDRPGQRRSANGAASPGPPRRPGGRSTATRPAGPRCSPGRTAARSTPRPRRPVADSSGSSAVDDEVNPIRPLP